VSDAESFVTVRTGKGQGKKKGGGCCYFLVQTPTPAKLLIEKESITEAEFMQKLSSERAEYLAILEKTK
jgi:hypothetical protein